MFYSSKGPRLKYYRCCLGSITDKDDGYVSCVVKVIPLINRRRLYTVSNELTLPTITVIHFLKEKSVSLETQNYS